MAPIRRHPLLRSTVALLLLHALPTPSWGFAAWMKCNRYLEEDEIIMNNKVRQAQRDDGKPIVKLAVFDSSGSRVDVPSNKNDGTQVVWIEPSEKSRTLSFDIYMDADSVSKLHDLQYVVETSPFEDSTSTASTAPSPSNRPSPTPNGPSLSAPAPAGSVPPSNTPPQFSHFVEASAGGGILCNGQRGHTRGKKGFVKYELVVKRKVGMREDVVEEDEAMVSKIVGGWSESHGSVTLTPNVIFKLRGGEENGGDRMQSEL